MASPQIENGYVKIANKLFDALIRYRLPGEQRQCLDVIIRKTYGYNKKADAISLSQFVEMTGIVKPHVVRALNELLSKKVIRITKNGNKGPHVYEINKDFESWKVLPKKVTLPKMVTSVTKNGKALLPKKVPTKDNNTKDNNTKDSNICAPVTQNGNKKSSTYPQDFEKFWNAYPVKKAKKAAFRSWKRVKKELPPLDELIQIIEKQKRSEAWTRENGRFIPHPTTWLNQGRWEDEIEIPQNDVKKNIFLFPEVEEDGEQEDY